MVEETIATGTEDLLASLEDGILTLVLNRPKARNAMSREMTGALAEQLAAAELNPSVRCIVLTGAGKSILPLIKNPQARRPYAFLSYGPQNTAVQTETMRYIRYEDGSEELYDHASDPHEWTNLANSKAYRKIKNALMEEALNFQSE